MTKYAFVIDQRKCIGCHACTVACKAEHNVPIGVYRTWVKYIEKGAFPNARRYFLVNRCNHCDDAPCVKICPTRALYKRSDGIVDFDASRCIGCKSCMQACPYDALYLDPDTHTAAKCNYCAHRTERGLEPACVVVCPERAIIAGDMHNPASELAQILAREPVRTRKPEQGTGPNVYYLGAEEAAIDPELAEEELPQMTMWSTLLRPGSPDERAIDPARSLRPGALRESSGTLSASTARARVVYDVPKNTAPWGWRVATYLATKSVGAGAPLVAALGLALYGTGGGLQGLFGIGASVIGGFFLACTLVLLVADLKRPERALYLLTKANPTSWLVWGGYILALTGLLEAAWFSCALAGQFTLLRWLLAPTALAGACAACYTALLFGQAEGRDFWQGPLLLPLLFVQAILAGAAALGILALALRSGLEPTLFLTRLLLLALLVHAALVVYEVCGPHANRHVALAARSLSRGGLRMLFWPVFGGAGVLLPAGLLVWGLAVPGACAVLLALAGGCALIGLLVYEHCLIKAGQAVPLS